MNTKNTLKEKLRRGEKTVGLSLVLDSVQIAEEFAMSDIDYLYIDQQHGLSDARTLIEMIRATENSAVSGLVRVSSNDDAEIASALDAGAQGVIIPMVEDRAAAETAAAASRYAPDGIRSWGPVRGRYGLGVNPKTVNQEVLCLVMIETQRGLQNIDEILSVPGVDGVYVGTADLSISIGRPPAGFDELVDQRVLSAVHRIKDACNGAGKIVAISGNAQACHAAGFSMVTVASDINIIREYVDRRES